MCICWLQLLGVGFGEWDSNGQSCTVMYSMHFYVLQGVMKGQVSELEPHSLYLPQASNMIRIKTQKASPTFVLTTRRARTAKLRPFNCWTLSSCAIGWLGYGGAWA